MNDPKTLTTYTNEEAAAILARGLDTQFDGGRISHDELFETAREIGMTTLEIEAAVAAEVNSRAERIMEEQARAKAIRVFAMHLAIFVVTNAVLAVVDLKLWGGVVFYWVGLAWGALLALHGVRALAPIRALATPPSSPSSPMTAPRIEVRGAKMTVSPTKDDHDAHDASTVRRRASG